MIPKIIYFYFAKQILKSISLVTITFYLLLLLLQFVDLKSVWEIDLSIIFTMSLNLSFDALFNAFPMIIMLSFMLAFNNMNKNQEIVVSRSCGISMLQILSPAIIIAFIFGILYSTVLQPITIFGKENYQKLKAENQQTEQTTIKLSETGLWLKESIDKDNYRIINVQNIDEKNFVLKEIQIISFNKQSKKTKVINAQTASLNNQKLTLFNVQDYSSDNTKKYDLLSLKTSITKKMIQNVFVRIEKVSFWDLPSYIKYLRKSELNASEGIFAFNFLLSMPILFVAIVFVSGFFSAQPTARRDNKKMVRNGIISGFLLYFYVNSSKSLVFLSSINPIILGWMPTISMLFLGIFLLLSADKVNK